jgi:hypothetical protein
MNAQENSKDGFTQVQGRKRPTQKTPILSNSKQPSTSNSFEILNQLSDSQAVENPHQFADKEENRGKVKINP